jgi:hypothetical protein
MGARSDRVESFDAGLACAELGDALVEPDLGLRPRLAPVPPKCMRLPSDIGHGCKNLDYLSR